ncbi:MAG: ABC transporter ATP-binding protein [Oscillospiraceae bacterium]|nr:ABC transporter ATP-binding protein [Oscillospiraceae bacterium]
MDVTLKNLTKRFPNRNKHIHTDVVAVNDFSITIPDGQIVSLLGPSGCGKSTVLNMISGLLKPSSGKIYFGGEDVTELPPEKRGIGMVFQSYALYPHLTARENIMFPLQNFKGADKLTKEQMAQRVNETAELVQISEYLDRKPGELSGGQQQRVAIARALVKLPKALLLDEPLSNLDARLRIQTREEIRRIQRETKITTVFVTHDQDEAMSISDTMVVMKAGELQQIGKPQQIYDDPKNLFVAKFLGAPPINVFFGHVRDGYLYIGEDAVLPITSEKEGEVFVCIRPEGFVPAPDGPFRCSLNSVDVMGRDVTVLFSHPSAETKILRAIVPSENVIPLAPEVSFSLKPAKTLLFDKTTQERIAFSVR